MARFKWRAPVSPDGTSFADWLSALRGQGYNGVYLIQYALIQELEPRDNVMDGHTLWWRMVTRRKGHAVGQG